MEDRYNYQDIPERISGLNELAYNFWWSWNSDGRLLFKKLSRIAWKMSKHNPVKMLSELEKEILENASKDPEFLKFYDLVMDKFNKYMNSNNS
jgi:starch phosphorylase